MKSSIFVAAFAGVKAKVCERSLTGDLLQRVSTLRALDLVGESHLRGVGSPGMETVIVLALAILVSVELLGQIQVTVGITVLLGIGGILRSQDVAVGLVQSH